MPVALVPELDDRAVHRLLGGVQVPDEVRDAALVAVADHARLAVDVSGRSSVSVIRRPRLRNAISCSRRDSVSKLQSSGLEDRAVRPERGRGARARSVASPLVTGVTGSPLLVGLAPDVAVPAHLHLEPRGQRVDHRDADAVQAAGNRVGLAVELAAGVQRGVHDLDRGTLLAGMQVHRDAAAVVADPDAAVGQQGDLDRVGVPGQRLVHRVVHDLVDQVVQAALAGGADVHAGSLAYGLETLEDGDRACVVGQSLRTPPAGTVL